MPTITEALAEIKTIAKRVEKKQEFITQYLFRQEKVRDPLTKDGGSAQVIAREMQSVNDLLERLVELRRLIHAANADNVLAVKGVSRTMADWIVWKREVAPVQKSFLGGIRQRIQATRADLQRKGMVTVETSAGAKADDIVVEIDEKQLANRIEEMDEVLGTLDGLLSHRNATITV